jgi:hypothetical protein
MADYVNLKDQRRMRFVVPPPEVMDKFAATVDPLLHTRGAIREESHHLQHVWDALLERLVTGRIDVSHLDLDTGVESVG